MQKDRIQLLNPKTKRWVKINTKTGAVISHKKSNGEYKNVEVYEGMKKKNEEENQKH